MGYIEVKIMTEALKPMVKVEEGKEKKSDIFHINRLILILVVIGLHN